jgi:hypothetical protein
MKIRFYLAAGAVAMLSGALMADTLELKSGEVYQGKVVGGNDQTISFQTGTGTRVFERSNIQALNIGSGGAAATGAAGATGGATSTGMGAATGQPAQVTVPAGTPLQVRMTGGITSSQPPGTKFSGTLLMDLVVNGVRVAPAGTVVSGQIAQSQQAGRLAGQSGLSLVLTDIGLPSGSRPIATDPVALSGQAEGRRTGRRAAGGAAIGAIAGGGEGAAKGAAIGAAAGVVRKGDEVDVQPGATLEFGLAQPFNAPAVP